MKKKSLQQNEDLFYFFSQTKFSLRANLPTLRGQTEPESTSLHR